MSFAWPLLIWSRKIVASFAAYLQNTCMAYIWTGDLWWYSWGILLVSCFLVPGWCPELDVGQAARATFSRYQNLKRTHDLRVSRVYQINCTTSILFTLHRKSLNMGASVKMSGLGNVIRIYRRRSIPFLIKWQIRQ